MEIGKAYKRRAAKEKKKQEQINLAPARARQPESRSIRYDNIKSAVAEEGVIALAVKDPSLLDLCGGLTERDFSVPLLGKVFAQLLERHRNGLAVGISVLSDLTTEEMSHLTRICQNQQGPVNEKAFQDCVLTLRDAAQVKQITTDDELLAFRNKLKESKGTSK